MKPVYFLPILWACGAKSTTTYPSSTGPMGVGANPPTSPSETPEDPADTGTRDTGDTLEDSGR